LNNDSPDLARSHLDRLLPRFFPHGRPALFVAGGWQDTPAHRAGVDPSTGRTTVEIPDATRQETHDVVSAALDAQPAWAALSLPERISHLGAFAEELRVAGPDLAVLESIDSGNPLRATQRDVQFGLNYLRDWPAHALTLTGRATRPYADGLNYTITRPYGTVGRIIAYNHPSLFAVAGMIFPLLAGNTVVVKAADQTPLATLALGALAARSLPPGVLNLISGGADAGDALVTDPRLKRLSFVGSGQTAQAIQSRLSQGGVVKHFTAELGGKNSMIVCPDIDMAKGVEATIAGMSLRISQGQSCQATARVLVHEDIFDDFVTRLAAAMNALSVGPAYDEAFDMGPLVSEGQRAKVESFFDDLPAGAEIVAGGSRPAGCPPGGFYVMPTLVVGAPPDSRIVQEEIFGPVVVVERWSTEREAIESANSSALGLTASIWSKDIDRALRIAHSLEAGYIWVNDANRHYPGAPFGGVKGSGVGREESLEELVSYSELSSINIRISPEDVSP